MTTILSADRRTLFVRTAGQLIVVAAFAGAVGGLVTGFIPTDVEPSQYSYPYTPTGFLVAEIVFALNHVLILVGMFGISRSGVLGDRTFGHTGVWISVVGWALLTLCEVGSMTLANSVAPTPRTETLGMGYGVATVLTGVGLVLAGVAIARQGAWAGWARFVTLACGIAVFIIVIPGVFGPFLAGRLVLTLWMLMLGALGLALIRSTRDEVS
jgi:hypothetical protein